MFVLQRGTQRPCRMSDDDGGGTPIDVAVLPNDVPELAKGDWKYSLVLRGWIGHLLSESENKALYKRRIA